MSTFQSIFGVSAAEPLGLIIAIALILFLLGLLYFVWKAVASPRFPSSGRGKQARLAVSDATVVSERRRLVLVRRDDIEHLILIGGPNDLVIESNIIRTAPARPLEKAAAPKPTTATPEVVAPAKTIPADTAAQPATARQTSPALATPQRAAPVAPVARVATAAPEPVATPVRADRPLPPRVPTPTEPARSMSDEMDALLDEMTPPRR
ncbi:flagellar biosynthetic protein FliO [Rhizobiaceae bacterium]|nr:flagellar biosynthetic protein FliO [Rhizobiaceae bacterium]